jgi:hypothetical protein
MGYYSQLDNFPLIKKELLGEFNEHLKYFKKWTSPTLSYEEWADYDKVAEFFNYIGIEMDEEGDVHEYHGETYAKFYSDRETVEWLKKYAKNGETLTFTGEDGEKWGYIFDDGDVYNIKNPPHPLMKEVLHEKCKLNKLPMSFEDDYVKIFRAGYDYAVSLIGA